MTDKELKIKLNISGNSFAGVETGYLPNSQNQDYFCKRIKTKTTVPKWDYSNNIGYTLKATKIVNSRVCFSVLTLGNMVVLDGIVVPANFCGSTVTMRLFL